MCAWSAHAERLRLAAAAPILRLGPAEADRLRTGLPGGYNQGLASNSPSNKVRLDYGIGCQRGEAALMDERGASLPVRTFSSNLTFLGGLPEAFDPSR